MNFRAAVAEIEHAKHERNRAAERVRELQRAVLKEAGWTAYHPKELPRKVWYAHPGTVVRDGVPTEGGRYCWELGSAYLVFLARHRAQEAKVCKQCPTRAALQPRLDRRRENQAKPRGGKA